MPVRWDIVKANTLSLCTQIQARIWVQNELAQEQWSESLK